MKLIYITSKRYPSSTADHLFIKSMAEAFTVLGGANFVLYITGAISTELANINARSLSAPRHLRSLFYFLTVFFSNDPYILSSLIWWKKIIGFKYSVCSDWHMLFNDWRDTYIAQGSDYLISTTAHLKKLIVEKTHILESKVLVAYGGVSLDLFDAVIQDVRELRMHLKLPLSDTLVGYVGFYKTMKMSKGIDTMLGALATLPSSVKMVCVGGRNNEIEEYQKIAQELGVLEKTLFIPAVPAPLIPLYEKAMDMLVIPYPDQPHFGFPMKVYEYMASKRIILYSNLPIIAEVLRDVAIAFEPDNASDLALKITNTLEQKTQTDVLVARAYEKVKDATWLSRAERIISFLSDI